MGGGALASGAVVGGRYTIVRELSSGGMGAVYEAAHLFTKKRVALKTMLPGLDADPRMSSDFDREMSVTAAIECPYLVQVLDAGIDGTTRFIVMELLEGENLAEMVRRRGALEVDEVLALLAQSAAALDATHAQGVIHRDLKPENLFVTRVRGRPHLKVLDFGIARAVSSDTMTRCMGTPLYMAPEQLAADRALGPATDRYALGQIAFTLLVGAEYFRPSDASTHPFKLAVTIGRGIDAAASDRALELGRSLDPAFDAWFARACALEAGDRFPDAASMATAFADAFGLAVPSMLALAVPEPMPRERVSGAVAAISSTSPQRTTGPEAIAATIAVSESAHAVPLVPRGESASGLRVATPLPSLPHKSVLTEDATGTFARLVEVLTPFRSRAEAEADVRRAVMKVCGLKPDASRVEYIVEELMTHFPKSCVSTRAEMCIALVAFCERERKSRHERARSAPPNPAPDDARRSVRKRE